MSYATDAIMLWRSPNLVAYLPRCLTAHLVVRDFVTAPQRSLESLHQNATAPYVPENAGMRLGMRSTSLRVDSCSSSKAAR